MKKNDEEGTARCRHSTHKIDPKFISGIATKTSELENDSGFITLADLPVYGGEMGNG